MDTNNISLAINAGTADKINHLRQVLDKINQDLNQATSTYNQARQEASNFLDYQGTNLDLTEQWQLTQQDWEKMQQKQINLEEALQNALRS